MYLHQNATVIEHEMLSTAISLKPVDDFIISPLSLPNLRNVYTTGNQKQGGSTQPGTRTVYLWAVSL